MARRLDSTPRTRAAPAIAAGYLATIVVANALIAYVGLVPVGFGLMAPAGVFAAGLAFSLRDALQEVGGRRWAVGAIIAGALLSAAFGAQLALASGVAFLTGELADLAVYTPLRERSRLLAVIASNTVGDVVDSALFLWIAFGSLGFLAGQIVGKAEVTALTVAAMLVYRRSRNA